MMPKKRISSALISVYNKEGLEPLVRLIHDLSIVIYSTGGTRSFLEELNIPVMAVEDVTGYPSILGGRVKTLHPKVFGGILAIRSDDHLSQLAHFEIPMIDLVIVDLYPFEDTVASSRDEEEIIEKIDIGGISLIRAAAKNFHDVVVIPSKRHYGRLGEILQSNALTTLEERKSLALEGFRTSSSYDLAISEYFGRNVSTPLRYGENPHQKGWFKGDLSEVFDFIQGKELSYNNLLDVDAAVRLMNDFNDGDPCFAVLKHNNPCGLAVRKDLHAAWKAALAGDPLSAFGGVLICNRSVDRNTALEIDQLFYEVLIAPSYEPESLAILQGKKNRILLRIKEWRPEGLSNRTCLNGELIQEDDLHHSDGAEFKTVTRQQPTADEMGDLVFAVNCIKHLKSNAIALVRDRQLIGMGCGQTSRVDACRQAIEKAAKMGFDTRGAVMSSEAFFPFPDCVELAGKAGISAIAQPGGSIQDQKSIDKADELKISMVLTGIRHFKH